MNKITITGKTPMDTDDRKTLLQKLQNTVPTDELSFLVEISELKGAIAKMKRNKKILLSYL